MLKNPRLLQLFAQAPLHEALPWTPLRQGFARQIFRPSSRPIPPKRSFTTSHLRFWKPQKLWRWNPSRAWRQARHNSSQAREAPKAKRSLSERMKDMSRKYGWTVTGIYLGLSVLDFPFCFLAVRWFGAERIAGVEHAIVDGFWDIVEKVIPSLTERRLQKQAAEAAEAAQEAGDAVAEDARGKNPGLGTQLLLAYGVHKSLIFFRIPITLAITPKVVKTLRSWGWKIGKQAK
ncbi:hypothetical protein AC578_7231 [Pseudocercospora eumusae]|uniref:DUF1279 domain-containing protein n=1 Tax=Pseudocercospora eumusae TaxID=321146 RepID=A0A139HWM8_9PEZI|nr:hypothetical protein AC578_7231 [Pseudocercospora eumusae]